MTTDNFPKILTEKINDRNIKFRNALFDLIESNVTEDNSRYLIDVYSTSKLPEIREKVVRLLYNKTFPHLKDFFMAAYKKERYLHAKLLCLRGFAQFVPEEEVDKIMVKFNETLAKRPLTTPYNYVEYSYLKGKNALPYLVSKYHYACFKNALELVDKQYNDMPSAFKGHFTTDELGDVVSLRSPQEASKLMSVFFEQQRR